MSIFRWHDYSPHGEACYISQADQVAASGVVRHSHDYYEIFRVASGTGWSWCSELEHPLRAGHMVFVRPKDMHGFRTELSSEPFVFVNVAFSAASWAQLRQRYGWHQRAFFSEHAAEPAGNDSGPINRPIRRRALCRDAQHAAYSGHPGLVPALRRPAH